MLHQTFTECQISIIAPTVLSTRVPETPIIAIIDLVAIFYARKMHSNNLPTIVCMHACFLCLSQDNKDLINN